MRPQLAPKTSNPTIENEDLSWEVEAVLSWHDEDAKAAIATLLQDCRHLRAQLALAEGAMSRGMVRGWRPAFERSLLERPLIEHLPVENR
ncbi:hypothetical protein FHX08_000838 [Rhizobium sp. BK529]|uniref:hypothetical protein n=1 Tax=unclassified Rhizobium TaxID=2613769 RepID=UPI00104F58A7|nr:MULTISPECIES: hypothetical protein [unclassified Rhizobium]MBB3590494.1 hypothetical protein [Rhizobium sp. BK529]TCS05184.1 hypothetical protein EV281_103866 [Rhizobium sp. BK418]